MIEDAKKDQIEKMRESGLTIKQIAKALEIGESSVQRYSSSTPDKDNELDEKISNDMTKIMLLEGYDFEGGIKPLIYALKDEVNEMNITLWSHIYDIKNNTKTFLRITDNPMRLYYIFMVFASNLNLITDHINPEDFIDMVDNFCEREVGMEEAEEYIAEIKETAKLIMTKTEEKWDETKKKIENAKKEAMKDVESKSKTLLKNSKEEYAEYQKKIDNAKKELTLLHQISPLIIRTLETLGNENQELTKMLKESDKKNSLLEKAETIISEMTNEQQQPQ